MGIQRPVWGVGSCWGWLLLYICATCCSSCTAAGEEAYSEESFPNPMEDYQACGVSSKFSYVCDPSNSLYNDDNIQQLNNKIESLRSVETCLCDDSSDCRKASRHTIFLALVPRIKFNTGGFPDTNEAELTAARRFAEHLRDSSWSVRDDGCAMQAYIVYDLHTNRLWTATNYYGKKIITNDRAGEVARSVKGDFLKYNMIFAGFEDMISKYKQFLEDGPPGLKWWEILLIVLGSIAGFLVLVCLCCCCCRGCKGGGGGGGGVFSGGFFDSGGGGCGGGGGGGGGCGGGGGD